MYEYRVILKKVIDGDTVDVHIDLGFGVWLFDQRFRLEGINAPEVRGSERVAGRLATTWLTQELYGEIITMKTTKSHDRGKYGRWLGTLYVRGVNLNEKMIEVGHAKPATY